MMNQLFYTDYNISSLESYGLDIDWSPYPMLNYPTTDLLIDWIIYQYSFVCMLLVGRSIMTYKNLPFKYSSYTLYCGNVVLIATFQR